MDLSAKDDLAAAAALGYLHAKDRGVQLYLSRIVAQGRLSELLRNDAETLAIDRFLRGFDIVGAATKAYASLSEDAKKMLTAYAAGVNQYRNSRPRPWEFLLVGYVPAEWKPMDSVLLVALMPYPGLAELQVEAEKTIIQAIKKGTAAAQLFQRAFQPHMDDLDEELSELVRKLKIERPFIPADMSKLIPTLSASNNFVIHANRSSSESALMGFDPHMPVDRTPGMWYEVVIHLQNGDYRMGMTLPGLPGLIMGRTKQLSFSFTYGCMDVADYFIEDCKGSKCRVGDQWVETTVRTEVIRRKGEEDLKVTYLNTVNGVIERADATAPADLPAGLYLARGISTNMAIPGAFAFLRLAEAKSVQEGMAILQERNLPLSANFLLADSNGNIGYVQTGPLPVRRGSGLLPHRGWDVASQWKGLHPPTALNSAYNPPEGYLYTVNNDMNSKKPGAPLSINLHIGTYRSERLKQMLNKKFYDLEDLQNMQCDTVSNQLQLYAGVLRSHFSAQFTGMMLFPSDPTYAPYSPLGPRFDEIIRRIHHELFVPVLGEEFWTKMAMEDMSEVFSQYFDRLVIDWDAWNDELLWKGRTQDAFIGSVIGGLEQEWSKSPAVAQAQRRTYRAWNIFFQGALPSFLGFDPKFTLPGSAATLNMGRIVRVGGKGRSVKAASYRMVTDMGTDSSFTILPGGGSGDRFTLWYNLDRSWCEDCKYKNLNADPSDEVLWSPRDLTQQQQAANMAAGQMPF
jgi:penicillin amidase